MLIRHCALCNKEIQVSLPYDNSYVYYKTKRKWYHADCFTAVATDRILNGGWFGKTKDYVLQEVSKDNIVKLFNKHYNVSVPNSVFVKLDSIYKGTYKGIAQPIPPHELLDILERKMDYLDRNAIKRNLEGINRVNYDLAVAVGSYQSYKEWRAGLEAEKALAEQEVRKRQSYSYKLKGYVPPNEPEKENMFIFDDEE
jgi:hypothetical protein